VLNRRQLRKLLLIFAVVAAFAVVSAAMAAQSPQVPLAGSAIPQFVQPLPVLDLVDGTMATADGTAPLTIRMCEFWASVLPSGTLVAGQQPKTRVWGYIKGNTCPPNGPNDPAVDTYIGPVILATRGISSPIKFVNELGDSTTTQVLAYKYSTDQTLHWADPLNNEANACNMMGVVPAFGSECAQNYAGPIPAVVHLHGGEVPPELDGGPDAWYTSDGSHQGHGYYSFAGAANNEAIYKYPNTQEAAPIWFHDHTLGATRLNVFAGLAGAYLIKDDSLNLPAGLTAYGLGNELTVPLVIQDRSFDTNGQLFMPADSAGGVLWTPNPDHPYWVPEFVGDTIVVNGKAWPFFNVEPKRYRFLFLNGSNARTYEMFLTDPVTKVMGPPMYVIATDGGYLDAPVKIDPNAPKGQLQRLTMMPGERYEVIIDFSGVAPGTNLILRNVAKTPFPGGTSPQGSTVGRIMQFRVGPCTSQCGAQDPSYDPASGTSLRTGTNPAADDQKIVRLVNPATGTLAPGVTAAKTRQLTLNEVMGMAQTATDPVTGVPTNYPGGPLEILVNNTKWSGASPRSDIYNDFTPITVGANTTFYSELPQEGDTEQWEIINLTADAHPIHLHLVQFQIINRQSFNTNKYTGVYNAAFPAVLGDPVCIGGVFCPGFGPPLDYNLGNPVALGGNPDITPYLQGPARPPSANEAGWKDTVIAYPGQVTRIAVRWAPTDLPTNTAAKDLYYPFDPSDGFQHGYVWHCHIIDHEDNEMMRPDVVQLNPLAPAPVNRLLKHGTDY
jgi:spore coat protein A